MHKNIASRIEKARETAKEEKEDVHHAERLEDINRSLESMTDGAILSARQSP